MEELAKYLNEMFFSATPKHVLQTSCKFEDKIKTLVCKIGVLENIEKQGNPRRLAASSVVHVGPGKREGPSARIKLSSILRERDLSIDLPTPGQKRTDLQTGSPERRFICLDFGIIIFSRCY